MNAKLSHARQRASVSLVQEIINGAQVQLSSLFFYPLLPKAKRKEITERDSRENDKPNLAVEMLCKFANSTKTGRRSWTCSDFRGNDCWSSGRKNAFLNVGKEN